jgi:uncharacterized coiled-coil DUF342 family protein
MEAKLWTTLDGLHALLADHKRIITDIKVTLEKQKALVAVHAQNAEEISKAPIASLQEFKSLKEGAKRLRESMKANLKKAQEVNTEISRINKEISINTKKLEELEVRAKALQSPTPVVELFNEDKRSPTSD